MDCCGLWAEGAKAETEKPATVSWQRGWTGARWWAWRHQGLSTEHLYGRQEKESILQPQDLGGWSCHLRGWETQEKDLVSGRLSGGQSWSFLTSNGDAEEQQDCQVWSVGGQRQRYRWDHQGSKHNQPSKPSKDLAWAHWCSEVRESRQWWLRRRRKTSLRGVLMLGERTVSGSRKWPTTSKTAERTTEVMTKNCPLDLATWKPLETWTRAAWGAGGSDWRSFMKEREERNREAEHRQLFQFATMHPWACLMLLPHSSLPRLPLTTVTAVRARWWPGAGLV